MRASVDRVFERIRKWTNSHRELNDNNDDFNLYLANGYIKL